MAADALGLPPDPQDGSEQPDYLGRDVPRAFKGQPALPVTGASAFGSPSAPVSGQQSTSPFTGGGPGVGLSQGSPFLSLALSALGKGKEGYDALQKILDDPRYATGTPGNPLDQVSGGELGIGAGPTAAESPGLLEAFQAGGLDSVLENVGGLGAIGSAAGSLLPIILSFFQGDEAFNFFGPFGGPTNRAGSVAHDIATQEKDLPIILQRLQLGAIDPSTLAGMSDTDLRQAFQWAKEAYASAGELSTMFGTSGRTEAGVKHPNFDALKDPTSRLEAVDFFDMVAAQDMLNKRGFQFDPNADFYGLPLEFGEALQALEGFAGIPHYGERNLSAYAPWEPLYKGNPGKQVLNTETGQYEYEQASGPADYLSQIGADPALAAKIAPLIEGVQPGQWMDTLRQLFAIENPDVANSIFGGLQAREAGGGSEPPPPPGPSFTQMAEGVSEGQAMSPGGGGRDFAADRLGVTA